MNDENPWLKTVEMMLVCCTILRYLLQRHGVVHRVPFGFFQNLFPGEILIFSIDQNFKITVHLGRSMRLWSVY